MRSCCLMGIQFQFLKMEKNSGNQLHIYLNILNIND